MDYLGEQKKEEGIVEEGTHNDYCTGNYRTYPLTATNVYRNSRTIHTEQG